jgi:Domain of unknown function (DUF4347)/FG-GAP repeat
MWGIEELVLYACEVGQDRDLLARLGEQTSARVAAATGKVGNIALGGSWRIVDGNGNEIETLAFSDRARQSYQGILVSFVAQSTFAAGNGPFFVAVEDFNGDGSPDLAVANRGSNTVSVLLNIPVVTITASDPNAAEAGSELARSGLAT